jgi:hypothetical protein
VVEYDINVTDSSPLEEVVTNPPSGSVFPAGTTAVTTTATDAAGNQTQYSFNVTVQDQEPPTIQGLTASPSVLEPPNHKMVEIILTPQVTDNSLSVQCGIVEVTSNEPINGTGDGDQEPDWQYLPGQPLQVLLRAERAQNGVGRTYTIRVRCSDPQGNSTEGIATVFVPKN